MSVGRHSSLGGPQRLNINRIVLYGRNLIPMEKLHILGGHAPQVPIHITYIHACVWL